MEGPVIDESVLSTKELLGLQQAEERLKRDFIDRLKRVMSFICYLKSLSLKDLCLSCASNWNVCFDELGILLQLLVFKRCELKVVLNLI